MKRHFAVLFFIVVLPVAGVAQGNAILDSTTKHLDSSYTRLPEVKGFYLNQGDGWDSLRIGMDACDGTDLWGDTQDWNWTRRYNSALGGITYNALVPVDKVTTDGVSSFLHRDQRMPQATYASSPRSDLRYLMGLGGGQQFGLRALTPVDTAAQLVLDYTRTNTVGFYRNEGSDGHELYLRLDRGAELLKKGPTSSIRIGYFEMTTGENGGLSQSDFFETNVPTLRRNFAVSDSRAAFKEREVLLGYDRELGSNLIGTLEWKADQWSVQSSESVQEYFWDSTANPVVLDSRALSFDDTTGLIQFVSRLSYEGLEWRGWKLAPEAEVGLDVYSSDDAGWDGYRIDSAHALSSFSQQILPFVRVHAAMRKSYDSGQLDLNARFHLVGYNAGAYLLSGQWDQQVGGAHLSLKASSQFQPNMYRWELLHGLDYDYRTISSVYLRNDAEAGLYWKVRAWTWGGKAIASTFTGLRYLDGDGNLLSYNGSLARGLFEVESDRSGWNLQMQGYGGLRSGVGGFAMPNWGGRFGVWYQQEIGSRFEVKSGFDISAEDAFYAPTYGLRVPIFQLQQEHLAGTYPWMNVYFQARIGNFTSGVRIVNALEGVAPYSYYAYGATPRSDRWIQLSARWTLFN